MFRGIVEILLHFYLVRLIIALTADPLVNDDIRIVGVQIQRREIVVVHVGGKPARTGESFVESVPQHPHVEGKIVILRRRAAVQPRSPVADRRLRIHVGLVFSAVIFKPEYPSIFTETS